MKCECERLRWKPGTHSNANKNFQQVKLSNRTKDVAVAPD